MSKEKNDYYSQYQRNNAHNKAVKARNPCAKENEISMKCLDRNNYIKELLLCSSRQEKQRSSSTDDRRR
ncbi:hypothetical protein M8J76_003214 [Diaphorina citri]|nr:hypothetical protein M8J76_003214 [Diaphorina citri]